MALQPYTFPYPKIGPVARPAGFGCLSCVFSTFCPALYWFRRYTNNATPPDQNLGRACLSWSNDPAQIAQYLPVNARDLDENEYMYVQGVGSEPNRNGIVTPVTGASRSSEGTG